MGRPNLGVTQITVQLPNGMREKLRLLYPSLPLSQIVRIIVEKHVSQIEAVKGPQPGFGDSINELIKEANLGEPNE